MAEVRDRDRQAAEQVWSRGYMHMETWAKPYIADAIAQAREEGRQEGIREAIAKIKEAEGVYIRRDSHSHASGMRLVVPWLRALLPADTEDSV